MDMVVPRLLKSGRRGKLALREFAYSRRCWQLSIQLVDEKDEKRVGRK